MLGLSPGGLTVLALGAHADDIELGCGGTLLRLAGRPGTLLHSVVLTGAPQRAAEAQAAARAVDALSFQALGLPDGRLPGRWEQVKDVLEEIAKDITPDLVLAPRPDDAHQDHRTLAEVVPTVFRAAMVLGYEIHKQDGDRGLCNVYVPLSASTLQAKWELIDEYFPSQRGRDWWDLEVVAGLARLRGVEARTRYAEGFWCHRVILDLGPGGAGCG